MALTIADLKTDLTGIIHGTTTSKIFGLDSLIYRAARAILEDVDPAETVRIEQITNAVFDQVYDYQIPVDTKGTRIIDVRPQVKRTVADRFAQFYNEPFDVSKASMLGQPAFSVQWNKGVKSLRIKKNLIAGLLINGTDSLTNNGTWAATALASNLSVDTQNYITPSGSLRFDLGAGGVGSTGFLENSTMTAVDLSRDEDVGNEFVWVYLPTGSNFTNVILRWGSGAADYWEQTVTAANNSVAFQTGWNLLNFSWSSATQVGAPDSTAVTYLRILFTYNGTAMTAARVDDFVSRLGSIYEIEYYSKFLFRDATTGAFQETVTDDTNIINLDTDSYNLLVNKSSHLIAQQLQGSDGNFDVQFFANEYMQSLQRYRQKNKSQVIQPQDAYYSMPPKRGSWTRIRNG